MLMAHPAVLKNLIEQYETLRLLHAEDGSSEVRQRTPCVFRPEPGTWMLR
jgi:hypothetical protein